MARIADWQQRLLFLCLCVRVRISPHLNSLSWLHGAPLCVAYIQPNRKFNNNFNKKFVPIMFGSPYV